MFGVAIYIFFKKGLYLCCPFRSVECCLTPQTCEPMFARAGSTITFGALSTDRELRAVGRGDLQLVYLAVLNFVFVIAFLLWSALRHTVSSSRAASSQGHCAVSQSQEVRRRHSAELCRLQGAISLLALCLATHYGIAMALLSADPDGVGRHGDCRDDSRRLHHSARGQSRRSWP